MPHSIRSSNQHTNPGGTGPHAAGVLHRGQRAAVVLFAQNQRTNCLRPDRTEGDGNGMQKRLPRRAKDAGMKRRGACRPAVRGPRLTWRRGQKECVNEQSPVVTYQGPERSGRNRWRVRIRRAIGPAAGSMRPPGRICGQPVLFRLRFFSREFHVRVRGRRRRRVPQVVSARGPGLRRA